VDATTYDLETIVRQALAEDTGGRDVTADAVVPQGRRGRARIIQKQPGIVFGFAAARETFRLCGIEELELLVSEGQWRDPVPAEIAFAAGPAASLLAAERTALNFLSHLSGIATLTARFAEAVAGTGARILDTRKTTPGLRLLEKQAVAAGGGVNHRMGLYDAILIKENHATIAGGVGEAVRRARQAKPDLTVEVECRDRDEIGEAIEAGADRLLLDNMSPVELHEAVAAARADGNGPALEASGGITLANVREIAESGVDYISVGALTHSAPALDLSMTLET
jgi:nicotinate-nucleotide pyrophosphorylase (carboxylating)